MAEDSVLRESPSNYVEWTIDNFRKLPKKVNYDIQSPTFSLGKAEWLLQIYPNGESRYKTFGWIGIYLFKEASSQGYGVDYKMGIKYNDGTEQEVTEGQVIYARREAGFGKRRLIKRSVLLKTEDAIADDGSVTFFCYVKILNKLLVSTSSTTSTAYSPTISTASSETSLTEATSAAVWKPAFLPAFVEAASQTSSPAESTGKAVLQSDDKYVFSGTSTLSEDLKNMYISKNHEDITILVKNEKFSAHRNILAARSAVFNSMFKHELAEKSCGKVEITDCDPDTFEQFLLFLYTGKVDGMTPSKAVHLYATADKYDVKELKEESFRCMVRDVSVDSFCAVIHLAAVHNDSDLLKAATDFFVHNVADILPTTKWQDLITENPLLCNELFFKVMKSKK